MLVEEKLQRVELGQICRMQVTWILSRWVWSLSHRIEQQVECDAGRGQDSLSGAGSKRMQEQVAKSLSCCEIGGSEFYGLVVPKVFGWTKGNIPV